LVGKASRLRLPSRPAPSTVQAAADHLARDLDDYILNLPPQW